MEKARSVSWWWFCKSRMCGRCWWKSVDSGLNWQLSEQCRVVCWTVATCNMHQQTEVVLRSLLHGQSVELSASRCDVVRCDYACACAGWYRCFSRTRWSQWKGITRKLDVSATHWFSQLRLVWVPLMSNFTCRRSTQRGLHFQTGYCTALLMCA